MNTSRRGNFSNSEAGLPKFKQDLTAFIKHTLGQKYNGKSAPRLVLFSPTIHEKLPNRNLPDPSENNARLKLYTTATAEVAKAEGVPFVDLFHPTQAAYAKADKPLTITGVPTSHAQLVPDVTRWEERLSAAVASDAMKLTHNGHWVAHVFDHVAADHFVELVSGEWIRQVVQIVNHISRRARVHVHSDRPRNFVCPASDVQDSRLMGPGDPVNACLRFAHLILSATLKSAWA